MTIDDVEKTRDHVTISIEKNLERMVPFFPECSIHRIPERLLHMNRMAYIPKVISIGPFHHGKHKFKATEELKLRFFKSYQCRARMSVQDIVEKTQNWEEEAQQYYSEPINMSKEKFVKMMVLDGCFIVEFLIMNLEEYFPQNENKVPPASYKGIDLDIRRDLIRLENQLPFFVLEGLFHLISPIWCDIIGTLNLFKIIVHCFLNGRVFPIKYGTILFPNMLNQQPRHLVDFLSFYFVPLENKNNIEDQKYIPPSATQLNEAGVVFKKVEGDQTCIMDISFKDGTLNIPPLIIDDKFETCVRNLLAFTQFSGNENAIHYFRFLDDLITTAKDVNILEKKGIIMNHIGGSDKEISQLFNDICKNITITTSNCFDDIAKDLRQHCGKKSHKWMASLRHNYFHTPWALISFLAATFLIILTIVQTIFTVFPLSSKAISLVWF